MSDNVKIFRWIGTIWLILIGLILAVSLSPIALIPCLLAAAFAAPIPALMRCKKQIGMPSWVSVLASLFLPIMGLLFGGIMAAPPAEIDTSEPARIVLEQEVESEDLPSGAESETTIILEEPGTKENASESESEIVVDPESEVVSEETTEEVPVSEPQSTQEISSFSVHFIDVGQADAALVECDGHYMLIDGGNKGDSNVIYSVLKKAEVPKLDIVVGTHGHEDHIGGLPGAFNYTTADLTLCPVTSFDSDAFADFKKYADQKGGGITVPKVGATYALGSANVEILGLNSGSDANNTSIVLRIDYGETSFLFTGDAEREAEQNILSAGRNLRATVLKVGHHGSESSTSYVFLREVMPTYAVVSVGEGNSYGHPTDEVLSRLRDADVKTFRTDMQGDIFCVSDGKTVTFSVERNADADTLTAPAPSVVETETTSEAEPEPEPENEEDADVFDYIGNKNTKKFHETWCSSVKKMKEGNKYYYTGTRDEMIAKGYEPCKNCNP